MPPTDQSLSLESAAGQLFASTHWSVVLTAGNHESPHAVEALETLCRTYWYPLYAYVRRRGYSAHDAQDLTQAFFARLLEKNYPGQADPRKGKFRSFLLLTLNHFLSDEASKANARKRGGGQKLISLDEQVAEERYRLEPADELTPEKIFERRWAMTLLEQAVARLRQEYVAAGKTDLYEQLKSFPLGDKGAISYADVAARLALTESAVKSAIHRLRQRHRELVREQIANTVATPGEIDEEIRYLIAVISG